MRAPAACRPGLFGQTTAPTCPLTVYSNATQYDIVCGAKRGLAAPFRRVVMGDSPTSNFLTTSPRCVALGGFLGGVVGARRNIIVSRGHCNCIPKEIEQWWLELPLAQLVKTQLSHQCVSTLPTT